jgi:hypothetical protein
MDQFPSAEWLELYNEKESFLKAYSDFNEYFSAKELYNRKLHHIDMGKVNFPTGEIIVCDPLTYLDRESEPYFTKVPTGNFPVDTLVVEVEEDHFRYAATRIRFSEKTAVKHMEALLGYEDLTELGEDEYFGFTVESGLATIVDVATRDQFCDFVNRWDYENDEDKNLYDDFFMAEFEKSYQEKPSFQREGGDWINIKIPNSDADLPMIQTGFGDGTYPVYFGFDENNEVCEIVLQFIDLELAFG